jgi:hypothetical protein
MNKPLIIQACETLGVPPGIKVTDLRALVDLKLRILPEGSKEANMTRAAYDLLSTKLPETRIQEYNAAAFEWAKVVATDESQSNQPSIQQPVQAPPVQQRSAAPAPAKVQVSPQESPRNKELEESIAVIRKYNPEYADRVFGAAQSL